MSDVVGRRPPITAVLVALASIALAACSAGSAARQDSVATTTGADAATTVPTVLPGVRPSKGCTVGAKHATPTPSGPENMTVDGNERPWLLSTAGTSPKVPAPVVVAFHGMGQTAENFAKITDLPAQAAKAHMIAAIPQGAGSPAMWQPGPDGADAHLVTAILDELEATQCVDTARVYLAGFSVGAVMAATYGCADQERIAALELVSVQFPADCKRPMPVVAFHGTADPIVPYTAGKGAIGDVKGTEADMTVWAKMNGCDTGGFPVPAAAAPKVTRFTFAGCKDGSAVVLYRIAGGGHAWPGSDEPGNLPPGESVDATDLGLAFFAEYRR